MAKLRERRAKESAEDEASEDEPPHAKRPRAPEQRENEEEGRLLSLSRDCEPSMPLNWSRPRVSNKSRVQTTRRRMRNSKTAEPTRKLCANIRLIRYRLSLSFVVTYIRAP